MTNKKSAHIWLKCVAAPSVLLALTACGGGGGSSSTSNTNSDGEVLSSVSTGYALPSEISAVPTDNTGAVAGKVKSFGEAVGALFGVKSKARAAASALPANSDYNQTNGNKYVEERTLEQFDIIEEVMTAVAQTNYADAANINNGPYKAMIAWEEEENGVDIKTLEPWVIDSRMIVGTGPDGTEVDINRVLAWIEEVDRMSGEAKLIKAEFKIYQAATVNEDGSYADYGEWDLNVSFAADASSYFVAQARIDANGMSVVKVHESFTDEGPAGMAMEMKGVLYRAGDVGYGKVAYPDWESCWNSGPGPCAPATVEAKYAYNAGYLGVQEDTDPALYKDRDVANAVEMVHRYGLFYTENPPTGKTAGADVLKDKSFGFPISYEDDNGAGVTFNDWGYYGAWQGRHQIWTGGDLDPGTVVTRQDRPGSSPQTYVASEKYNGTLTKRTLVEGALEDIQGIPVETWINKHYNLSYNGGQWEYCNGWLDWQSFPPTCMDNNNQPQAMSVFSDFGSLVVGANDRKWVGIGRWDQSANGGMGAPVDYVYLVEDPGGVTWTGAGFYPAQMGMNGQRTPINGASIYAPTNGDNMWVDIGGSIYIQYSGEFSGPTTTTGWVQKTLLSFSMETWTPTFDPTGDTSFAPEMGREYYINSNGANFVVQRTSVADANTSYSVLIELQNAANPVNVASILPAGADYLRTPWRPDVRFTFVTDAADPNFMKLVYASDDPATPDDETGTVYESGEWGMFAYSDNGTPSDFTDDEPYKADGTLATVDQWGMPTTPGLAERPVQFNWEYSEGGWGTQQFLCSPDCTDVANFLILDDPIQLVSQAFTNGADQSKTLMLRYDGWMHGLPDLYQELSKNEWHMTSDIADKVIVIPAGTMVTDGGGAQYYVKPLETSVFLAEVGSGLPGLPDLAAADSVDLTTVPTFVDHNMGALPTQANGQPLPVKYSEGKLVE